MDREKWGSIVKNMNGSQGQKVNTKDIVAPKTTLSAMALWMHSINSDQYDKNSEEFNTYTILGDNRLTY